MAETCRLPGDTLHRNKVLCFDSPTRYLLIFDIVGYIDFKSRTEVMLTFIINLYQQMYTHTHTHIYIYIYIKLYYKRTLKH